MTIHHPIHFRSVRTLLADLVFFVGMLAPSSWRPRFEYHEATCHRHHGGVECTCSRAGGAS